MAVTLSQLLEGFTGTPEELQAHINAKSTELGAKILIEDAENIYIPKSRFDQSQATVKALTSEVDTNKSEIAKLTKQTEGNEEAQTTLQQMTESNKVLENKLKVAKIENTLIEKAAKLNSIAPVGDLISLIDTDKISIDGDNVIGLDEQVTSLQTSKPYLFKAEPADPADPNLANNGQSATPPHQAGAFGAQVASQVNTGDPGRPPMGTAQNGATSQTQVGTFGAQLAQNSDNVAGSKSEKTADSFFN